MRNTDSKDYPGKNEHFKQANVFTTKVKVCAANDVIPKLMSNILLLVCSHNHV